MMETIRSAANSIIVKIILSIIALAFIFTGFGGFTGFFNSSSREDQQRYIVKVDGEGLSRAAFEREAEAAIQNSGILLGDDSFVRIIRQSVLSSQIDDFLSYKFSESLKTKISDEQVKNVIKQQNVFFENGKFSNQLFVKLLKENGYTPENYAEALRSSIQQQQVGKALILSDFSLPIESDVSSLLNQSRTVYLSHYSLNNKDNSQFTVEDDEIQKYYDDNLQKFKHAPRLKMKYVINPYPEIRRDIHIVDADINTYYNQGKEGTMSNEKQSFSMISYSSLDEANQGYKALSTSKDAVKMQNLGWLTINSELPELFIKAALTKEGQISKPMEQDNQYYIVRLDKIERAKKLPFDFVKEEIKNKLIDQAARKIYDQQEDALEKASHASSIDEISKISGLKTYESKWTYENELYSIGRFPEVKAVAFSDLMVNKGKPTGNTSEIIYVPDYQSSFIIQVTDYQDEGISPLNEVKDKIKSTLLLEKKKAVFNKNVADTLKKLQEKGSAPNVKFGQRISVDRTTKNDQLDSKVVDIIFAAVPPTKGATYGVAMIDDTNAEFFALINVNNAAVSDISSQLEQSLLETDRNYFAKDLRTKAKIEIMPNANL